MNLDLQYLLFLQNNVRTDNLTPFMMGVSNFAISFGLMAAIFCIFWCVDKKSGYFMITSYCITSLINSLVKLSFCIYRPWIRDPHIVPAGDAIKSAGGYSFPSGHTQIITASFASGAVLTWMKQKWFSILLFIIIFTVAFSRNYLGVHTPQDVIVGFILGLLSVIWAYKLQNREKKDKKSDFKLLLYGIIIGIVSILYYTYKNYPTSFDSEGKLIVDPIRMMKDGFLSTGLWMGFLLGWFIEKYYINFTTNCSVPIKLARAVFGVGSLYLVYFKIGRLFYQLMSNCWANFFKWFLMIFYVMAIYPLIFKFVENLILSQQDETMEQFKTDEQGEAEGQGESEGQYETDEQGETDERDKIVQKDKKLLISQDISTNK